MQKELLRQQTRCKVLEEELENPLNVHRWRKLEVMYQHLKVPKPILPNQRHSTKLISFTVMQIMWRDRQTAISIVPVEWLAAE